MVLQVYQEAPKARLGKSELVFPIATSKKLASESRLGELVSYQIHFIGGTNMKGQFDLTWRLTKAAETSQFLKTVADVQNNETFAIGDASPRPLQPVEITQLIQNGNTAEDWDRILVVDPFDPGKVRCCTFFGDVVLGRMEGMVTVSEGVCLPSGLANATLVNCLIGHGALVRNIGLLSSYVIGPCAALLDCGAVTGGPTTFANGLSLPVGIETGGREVTTYAELDIATAALVAGNRGCAPLLEAYENAAIKYAERARSTVGIVGPAAVLCHTPKIDRVFIGPHARIDSAGLVSECTLLSSQEEPVRIESGAIVSRSIVQWGARVKTMAVVEESVLTEHSYTERHGKVTHSILGPNTGVAEGEVTACLLGPFVGFHHQSLLIAAVWPEGKGNVGAGANVGSNHTSRAADQEIWPGEGTFFGLGVNIKFPSDFREAPYSVFASGVRTLPQKLAFPFSLINSPSLQANGMSPALNELIPAWVLTDSLYMLRRNEQKYRDRNKARRTDFEFSVFRPEVVDLMQDACRRLESITQEKELYTASDVEGIGKNYLQEQHRRRAIDAYRFYTRFYALQGLKEKVARHLRDGRKEDLCESLAASSNDPVWQHQQQLLGNINGVFAVQAALRELHSMLEHSASEVERSKARDDKRGRRIISDYADAHTAAAADGFVKKCWEQTRRWQQEIAHLQAQLKGSPFALAGQSLPAAAMDYANRAV